MVILENIDIDIDIDKAILQNIDIDKISNRFKFGISNRATPPSRGGGLMTIHTMDYLPPEGQVSMTAQTYQTKHCPKK